MCVCDVPSSQRPSTARVIRVSERTNERPRECFTDSTTNNLVSIQVSRDMPCMRRPAQKANKQRSLVDYTVLPIRQRAAHTQIAIVYETNA
jgi:hypothetical protein